MKNNRATVVIEKIVLGGKGLARLDDGVVALIPFVLPGETVEIEIVARKKKHVQARLNNVLEPSPDRISPPCKYYSKCGGCDLQHASYSRQLSLKSEYFQETLARELTHDFYSNIQFEPILGCDNDLNYRQRVRLQQDRYGALGFYKKGSHDVIGVRSCLLAADQLNSVLYSLNNELDSFSLINNALSIELLFSPIDEKVVLIAHLSRKPRATDVSSAKKIAADLDLVKSVWLAVEGFAIKGPYTSDGLCDNANAGNVSFWVGGGEHFRNIKFSMEPGGFCQVNLGQNQQLIQLLLDWIADFTIKGRVLDLFSGMGNFSLPLAQSGFDVTAMDVQRSAIRSGKQNSVENSITSCKFFRNDAQSAVNSLIKNGEQFNLVLLDPPRQGCKVIISNLPALGAEYIIYISCDPATVARDLLHLSTIGYSIIRCRAVDMFPHTYHIESITLLKLVVS